MSYYIVWVYFWVYILCLLHEKRIPKHDLRCHSIKKCNENIIRKLKYSLIDIIDIMKI